MVAWTTELDHRLLLAIIRQNGGEKLSVNYNDLAAVLNATLPPHDRTLTSNAVMKRWCVLRKPGATANPATIASSGAGGAAPITPKKRKSKKTAAAAAPTQDSDDDEAAADGRGQAQLAKETKRARSAKAEALHNDDDDDDLKD